MFKLFQCWPLEALLVDSYVLWHASIMGWFVWAHPYLLALHYAVGSACIFSILLLSPKIPGCFYWKIVLDNKSCMLIAYCYWRSKLWPRCAWTIMYELEPVFLSSVIFIDPLSCFLVSLTDLLVIARKPCASSSLRDLNIVLFTKSSLPLVLLLNYLCLINSYLFFIFMFVSMFFGGAIQLLFHCIFNDHWYPHTFCHLQPPPPPTGIKIPFSGKPVRTTISTQIRYPLWNFDICIISYFLPQCYLSHFSVLYQFILLFD